MPWEMDWHDISSRLKKLRKKYDHEVKNVFDNLDTLMESLTEGARPEQLKKLGFVHSEPLGILALDQKGPGKGAKLKQLRLYVFPDERFERVHVLELGDKSTQPSDIAFCKRVVTELLEPEGKDDDPAQGEAND